MELNGQSLDIKHSSTGQEIQVLQGYLLLVTGHVKLIFSFVHLFQFKFLIEML